MSQIPNTKVKASIIDWNNEPRERPSIKAGKCKFPFKYKRQDAWRMFAW